VSRRCRSRRGGDDPGPGPPLIGAQAPVGSSRPGRHRWVAASPGPPEARAVTVLRQLGWSRSPGSDARRGFSQNRQGRLRGQPGWGSGRATTSGTAAAPPSMSRRPGPPQVRSARRAGVTRALRARLALSRRCSSDMWRVSRVREGSSTPDATAQDARCVTPGDDRGRQLQATTGGKPAPEQGDGAASAEAPSAVPIGARCRGSERSAILPSAEPGPGGRGARAFRPRRRPAPLGRDARWTS
jgi:hypothetical protein